MEEFQGDVSRGIEKLDRLGMRCCELGGEGGKGPGEAHESFKEYLKKTKNTVCGRHPIGVLLGGLSALEKEEKEGMSIGLEWKRYEQSGKVKSLRESSVSYASAVVTLSPMS